MDVPRHRLAATNLVVGQTDFLSLPVPVPWSVTRAVVTPEVSTTMRAGDRTWVAAGETRHVIFDRGRNLGLELIVRTWSGAARVPRGAREVLAEGQAVCNGHPAAFRIVRRGRGFLMPGEESALLVWFACPPTSRGILIDIAGQCSVEELRTFLRVMVALECH